MRFRLLEWFFKIVLRLLGDEPPCPHSCGDVHFSANIGPFTEQNLEPPEIPIMAKTVMTDSQQTTISMDSILDKRGNPTTVEGGFNFESSNPDLLQVDKLNDTQCLVTAKGPLGDASVNVSADADLGEGTKLVTGRFDFSVVAGEAAIISGSVGVPVEQPETPPAP